MEVYGSVSIMINTQPLISSLIDSPFAIPTRCTYFVKCALLQFGCKSRGVMHLRNGKVIRMIDFDEFLKRISLAEFQ